MPLYFWNKIGMYNEPLKGLSLNIGIFVVRECFCFLWFYACGKKGGNT